MSSIASIRAAALATPFALLVALAACSSSSSGGGTSPADAGADALPATPPPDAGPLPNDAGVAGCTEAEFDANDHTAPNDPRLIQGPMGSSPAQYTPHCMRVRAMQVVTFKSNLGDHPIDLAKAIGPDPYPITSNTTGTADGGGNDTETVMIAKPGVVKFNCDIHPSEMFGAIEVVP